MRKQHDYTLATRGLIAVDQQDCAGLRQNEPRSKQVGKEKSDMKPRAQPMNVFGNWTIWTVVDPKFHGLSLTKR